ncbi:MAG: Na+-dependent transporter [Methylomonas sp.]|nr:MAG: Na+-dependent transporter [Methylomonas sp.]PPD26678.1 MAG: Na+-dependent transporter [Methylomonas sp.]PPD37705.1 MAG: Na+-dependent transporter [Methylomonas sp.]PPD38486.1 MAG: Na+-dependent transporter [Methylomonas sp.]PPD55889.1 MAG: Na+-dependent transporter [Methylomonas sp.]
MKSISKAIEFLTHLIHRYFIWVIVASYFLAALLPGLGVWLREVELGSVVLFHNTLDLRLPPLMLSLLLFNAGLGVRPKELGQLLRRPQLLLGGLLGNVITPLSFIIGVSLIMVLWHNPEEVQHILVGLALVAAMPIAGASTAWSQNANGNLALSLGLVLLTTLLSPLLTPLVLHTVGFVTTGDYSEDLHEIAADGVVTFLGVWVVLPSLLGILMQRLVGEQRLVGAKASIKLVNYVILLLLNYSNASLSLPKALAQPDYDFLAILLVIVVALCVSAFATGYLVARVFHANRTDRVALMFGLGMNNNGTGLVLVSVALADHPEVMLPIIFYNLVQHLIASLVDVTVLRQGMQSYKTV